MTGFSKENRKTAGVLLVGIFAGLVISTAMPRADAAEFKHDDIMSAISAAVTTITNAITGAKDDIGITESVTLIQTVDPEDGIANIETVTVVPFESGKTFSGRISGKIAGLSGNQVDIFCHAAGDTFQIAVATGSVGAFINEEFACDSILLTVVDYDGGGDAGAVSLRLLTQYVETTNVS